ncbi:MAG: hypothetical protein R3B46_08300 [Phycisphaerales bacterium]
MAAGGAVGRVLTEVRSNFPVAQHLAIGDVIQSIDGMSLIAPDRRTETWDLISIIRTAIISRQAGRQCPRGLPQAARGRR